MLNQKLAKIFYEIADYLETERVPFKPYAYQKAALSLEALKEDVQDIYQKGGLKALKDLPGIGESIALKIEEYIKSGKIKYYEEFKRKIPIDIKELVSVEGVGPKRARVLYEKLGIKNLRDLERAVKNHQIASVFGFGIKTERNILQGIEFLKRNKGRFLLGEILPKAKEIYESLKNLKEVKKIDFAGSLRRKKETIGDVDFLIASSSPEKIMEFFVSLPGVVKIWGKGKTKASVRLKEGFDVDIRIVPSYAYGAALQYFTGSKDHNIILRKLAIEKGLKLSEYGLFKGKKRIAGDNEEEIYHFLGMVCPPPEIRENNGEIEAALQNRLPHLIDNSDIKGDLHCHCSWNGGAQSILEMAQAAMNLGYEYLGISDHTKFLQIEHGLDEKELLEQKEEIEKINTGFAQKGIKFRILQGCEANILADGSLDIKNEVLEKLDYVIGGIHSSFKMTKAEMTKRLIKAMQNPYISIISHPTGRILKKRDEYQVDLETLLKTAKNTNTILEINAYPERLDLNDQNIRLAKEMGVKMIINTDAHQKEQLRFIEYGIAQARRGWAEKKDIVNTLDIFRLGEILRIKRISLIKN